MLKNILNIPEKKKINKIKKNNNVPPHSLKPSLSSYIYLDRLPPEVEKMKDLIEKEGLEDLKSFFSHLYRVKAIGQDNIDFFLEDFKSKKEAIGKKGKKVYLEHILDIIKTSIEFWEFHLKANKLIEGDHGLSDYYKKYKNRSTRFYEDIVNPENEKSTVDFLKFLKRHKIIDINKYNEIMEMKEDQLKEYLGENYEDLEKKLIEGKFNSNTGTQSTLEEYFKKVYIKNQTPKEPEKNNED
jgi:hypothetical protein